MESLLSDLRYAARTLRKNPGFAFAAVLTLALGIGANTAVFSVVSGVLLRPLPFPDPGRLAYIGWQFGNGGYNTALTAYKYDYFRRNAHVFEAVATYRGWGTELGEGELPEEVRGLRVTEGFFRVAGIEPTIGRAFLPREDRPGGGNVVVLGHGLWRSHFGSSRNVIGRTIRLGREPYTVIGVMPADFQFPPNPESTQFLVPYQLEPDPRDGGQNYMAWARLRPGLAQAQVATDLQSVSRQFGEEHPELMEGREVGARLASFTDIYVGDTAKTLWVLLGAVAFVLLIACVNVANLLLARSAGRRREMAIRTAIGAGRARITRQLLTESLLLATVAAVIGVVLGQWSLGSLLALAPSSLPRADEIGLDARVLAFTAAVAVAAGVVFGLAAATHATRSDIGGALRERAGRTEAGGARGRVRSLFAASEAALAMVLLSGAGLLVASFFRLRSVDPGLDPRNVVAVEFRRTPEDLASAQDVWRFERQVLDRVGALPGVESAATTSMLPLSGSQYNFPMTVVGDPEATRGDVQWRAISPAYFEAMGIDLIEGRPFTAVDRASSVPVAIVDETFARKYFKGQNPIGRRIDIGRYKGEEVIPDFDDPEREIVGVVADVHALGLGRDVTETMYVPSAQAPDEVGSLGALVVRGRSSPGLTSAVLREIRAAEPQMPLPDVRPMSDVIGASMAQERFNTVLLGTFAGLALLLTMIGIYGVVSYSVRQRTGEIGIRVALGADRGRVVGMVIRQGMAPVAVGLAGGLAGALALTRLMGGLLYGVSPTDPLTLAIVAAVLSAVALLATYLPARRAARADPVIALRGE